MENHQAPSGVYYHGALFSTLVHQQQQELKLFWEYQRREIEHVSDFRNHQLPLARIKKIMKADEDVRMISAEAPILFSKACELFILELTIRSWLHAEENKRRTLQRNDIAAAIIGTQIFDFLVDIVPRDETAFSTVNPPGGGAPHYCHASATSRIVLGHTPVTDVDPNIYLQAGSQAWQSTWNPSHDGTYSDGKGNLDPQG